MRENERMTKYETDFHQWAFEQAQRLRSGEPVDVENVAEELESLGRSEEREQLHAGGPVSRIGDQVTA